MKDLKRIAYFPSTDSFYVVEEIIKIIEKKNETDNDRLRLIILGNNRISTQIAARLNGFSFVDSEYNEKDHELRIRSKISYSNKRSQYVCYAECSEEGQKKILESEQVDLIITSYPQRLKGFPQEVKTVKVFTKEVFEKQFY
ncbi:MAG: hypothetical protein E7298_00445 [Lachnospiraceae bacterium]|jgi:hypothetical protein|nr:hypothetical protein [Lachnospiraceae bacterium]